MNRSQLKDEISHSHVPANAQILPVNESVQVTDAVPSEVTSASHSPLPKLLAIVSWLLVILSFLTSLLLLICDIFTTLLPHAPISAAPLLLIGAASLCFQLLTRPNPLDVFKGLIVSCAFIMWGIDQLLPAGWFATTLGDVVIVLYVIDLGWIVVDRLRRTRA